MVTAIGCWAAISIFVHWPGYLNSASCWEKGNTFQWISLDSRRDDLYIFPLPLSNCFWKSTLLPWLLKQNWPGSGSSRWSHRRCNCGQTKSPRSRDSGGWAHEVCAWVWLLSNCCWLFCFRSGTRQAQCPARFQIDCSQESSLWNDTQRLTGQKYIFFW